MKNGMGEYIEAWDSLPEEIKEGVREMEPEFHITNDQQETIGEFETEAEMLEWAKEHKGRYDFMAIHESGVRTIAVVLDGMFFWPSDWQYTDPADPATLPEPTPAMASKDVLLSLCDTRNLQGGKPKLVGVEAYYDWESKGWFTPEGHPIGNPYVTPYAWQPWPTPAPYPGETAEALAGCAI